MNKEIVNKMKVACKNSGIAIRKLGLLLDAIYNSRQINNSKFHS